MARVKICGLSEPSTLEIACSCGASYVGFVFFEMSPRNVALLDAKALCTLVPPGICKTALVVNPTNAFLDQLVGDVPIDMLQLHGTETPARVAEIKSRFGLPVMKAVGIASEDDLDKITEFSKVADQLLVDAKPSKSSELPGGNGLTFDWKLLVGRRWSVPWMLAGGLTTENVSRAIELTGTEQVDVSSGVESEPGVKNKDLIARFLQEANV